MFKFLVGVILTVVIAILFIKIDSMIADKMVSWEAPEWFDKFIDWLFSENKDNKY